MAGYNAAEALDLLLDSSFEELDSGGEEEIEEDPAFPLPSQVSEESGESGGSDFEGRICNQKLHK